MAKKLARYEFDAVNNRSYPWGEWTDGSTWQIIHGEDFQVAPKTMKAQLRSKASNYGLSVLVDSLNEDTLVFRFVKKV